MMNSTLPLWAEIEIINILLAIILGLFASYITSEDQMRAKEYAYGKHKHLVRPLIRITMRPYTASIVRTILIMNIVALLVFLTSDFASVWSYFGGGFWNMILTFLVSFVGFVAFCAVALMMAWLANFWICNNLKKYYEREYKVDVEVEYVE